MAVVSSSQFALVRARREMVQAYQQCDWVAVKTWDTELGRILNEAFNDDHRDTRALLNELEKTLRVYKSIVAGMGTNQSQCWLGPEG